MQIGEDGKLHPVAFHSRKLHDAELRYPVHEKELLAIKEAIRVWECYLGNGMEITVLTDHESLKYMNTIRRPSRRLTRWIEEFQAWKLKIKYRRGSDAVVPDALSRRPDYNLNVMHEVSQEDYVIYMEEYLSTGILPNNEYVELVRLEAPHFLFEEGRLMRRISEGVPAPYLE